MHSALPFLSQVSILLASEFLLFLIMGLMLSCLRSKARDKKTSPGKDPQDSVSGNSLLRKDPCQSPAYNGHKHEVNAACDLPLPNSISSPHQDESTPLPRSGQSNQSSRAKQGIESPLSGSTAVGESSYPSFSSSDLRHTDTLDNLSDFVRVQKDHARQKYCEKVSQSLLDAPPTTQLSITKPKAKLTSAHKHTRSLPPANDGISYEHRSRLSTEERVRLRCERMRRQRGLTQSVDLERRDHTDVVHANLRKELVLRDYFRKQHVQNARHEAAPMEKMTIAERRKGVNFAILDLSKRKRVQLRHRIPLNVNTCEANGDRPF